jgi:hypothetical protein
VRRSRPVDAAPLGPGRPTTLGRRHETQVPQRFLGLGHGQAHDVRHDHDAGGVGQRGDALTLGVGLGPEPAQALS